MYDVGNHFIKQLVSSKTSSRARILSSPINNTHKRFCVFSKDNMACMSRWIFFIGSLLMVADMATDVLTVKEYHAMCQAGDPGPPQCIIHYIVGKESIWGYSHQVL